LIIAVWYLPFLGGCGSGLPDPPAAKSSTAASNTDDPDVYKPSKPRSTIPPPPLPPSKKDESVQNQPAQSDPDVYVPEKLTPRPATPLKKDQTAQKDSDARKSDNLASPLQPSPPLKKDQPVGFDPDVYVSEKPLVPLKSVLGAPVEKKSANDTINTDKTNLLDLKAQVLLYQNDKADAPTRLVLEKQFVAKSREALSIYLGFNKQQPAALSLTTDSLYSVGTLLWDSPFIDFLDLQHQALTTLAQRPTAVTLAVLIPNNTMRADLRRTLSRHWSEGPKAIRTLPAADYPLAEPGFITVLKSLIRENRVRSSPQLRSAKAARPNFDLEYNSAEPPKSSPDTDWPKLLEELVRDYCRRGHMASLARSAAAYRSGASSSHESRKSDSSIPLLPGCEIIAAHSIDWPGEYVSHLPNMAGNDLSLNYQRIEKRMKLSKPLIYYRRQVKSCIERPIPDGLWLDGFVELKGEERLRSVDILITCPTNSTIKSATEEQELTVEILSVEVRKSHE
jgi:hypothetical protein